MHFVGVSAIALFLVLSESAVNGDEAPSCTRCKNLVKTIREKETTDLKKALFTEILDLECQKVSSQEEPELKAMCESKAIEKFEQHVFQEDIPAEKVCEDLDAC